MICCWKCAVSVKDKQEYKKFIEDMENAKFAEVRMRESILGYMVNRVSWYRFQRDAIKLWNKLSHCESGTQ